MTVKPAIGVDVDDVLFATKMLMIRLMNEFLGTNLQIYECHQRRIVDNLGLTDADEQRFRESVYPTFRVEDIPPMPEALIALERLRPYYDFVAITARQDRNREATEISIGRHFPMVSDILYGKCPDPNCGNADCAKRGSKFDLARGHAVRAFVDDHEEQFIGWNSGVVTPYCLAHPWNTRLELVRPDVYRAGWREITVQLLAHEPTP